MTFVAMLVITLLAVGCILGGQLKGKSERAKLRYMIRAAVIAGVYATITYLFKPISYGVIQIRVSEALTLLPLIESAAIPGLFIGCLVANILGGIGLWDIYLGSLITLVAAYITSKMPNPVLGALPPIVFNAMGVASYLSLLFHTPYWVTALYIGVGQLVSVVGLGIPLYYFIQKTSLKDFFQKEGDL